MLGGGCLCWMNFHLMGLLWKWTKFEQLELSACCDRNYKVAEACWANGLALQHAPDFKDDWEVVMCAVSKNGTALMWASSVLQADKQDRDLVLAAVQKRGMALRYAGEVCLGLSEERCSIHPRRINSSLKGSA
eukprot:symbB.v1.2.031869.t1/scaffold3747.1/size51030/3